MTNHGEFVINLYNVTETDNADELKCYAERERTAGQGITMVVQLNECMVLKQSVASSSCLTKGLLSCIITVYKM